MDHRFVLLSSSSSRSSTNASPRLLDSSLVWLRYRRCCLDLALLGANEGALRARALSAGTNSFARSQRKAEVTRKVWKVSTHEIGHDEARADARVAL